MLISTNSTRAPEFEFDYAIGVSQLACQFVMRHHYIEYSYINILYR